ncbi:MAG: prepilin-type N-terminal cleavage/methylation domain-containing protein [Sulfuricellaceae bacterium]|nr:prepilin-type N-terminal cleavage/methylation domain-containing protein [Sulfuricellaceae bacterium]
MPTTPSRLSDPSQCGLTLIELLMFIVIVAVGVAGILTVMNYTSVRSADPMIRKQEMAIAESLLEEIELKPFTFCDPDDPQSETATSAAVGANGCTSAALVEQMGAETGETRTSQPQFDNVNDYNQFAMVGGIQDITGTAIPALNNYSANVAISIPAAPVLGTIPAADTLLITVTVTGPDGTSIVMDGYRTRYAPRT